MATQTILKNVAALTAVTYLGQSVFGQTVPPDKEHLKSWVTRWDKGVTKGWQLDSPHEMLMKHKDLLFDKGTQSRVFVPLCGKDVSLKYLASLSEVKQVVGVEASSIAVREFSKEHPQLNINLENKVKDEYFESFESENKKLMFKIGDFFDSNSNSLQGQFDVIYDRASLVAIDPKFRSHYSNIMKEILKTSSSFPSKMLLVTMDRRDGKTEAIEGGPPYSVNKQQVYELYQDDFNIKILSEEDVTNHPQHLKFIESGITSLFEITFLLQKKNKNDEVIKYKKDREL